MKARIDFKHIPHPRIERRKAEGPAQVSDQRSGGFNGRVAVWITMVVGSMWCAYAFAVIAFVALPAAIQQGSPTVLVNWLSSNFLQLILLPIIIVGQAVLAKASDKRAQQTYDDAEAVLHEAQQIQNHLKAQDDALNQSLALLDQLIADLAKAATPPLPPPPPARANPRIVK